MTRRSLAAVLPLTVLLAALGGGPAAAEARVTVANEFGEATADTTYSTTLTVSGSGFQAVQGAMGGVYVFFGTVDGGWRPSKGGRSGVDFRYVPDSETQDNQGFQRFVAFPGSSTQAEAHTTMGADGSWTVTMTVPGPTFQTTGRSGGVETVDCRKVTCGVITVGAHGVVNGNNETFTPVTFAEVYGSDGGAGAKDDDGAAAAGQDDAAAEGEAAGDEDAEEAEPLEPVVDVDRATAVVGRVMTFTAQGFTPGEQLVGSLGAGLAAVGPLVAGTQGEVAGVLQLPADLKAGTHTFTLTSAATGTRAEVTFQVAAAPAAPAPLPAAEQQGGPSWEWIALGVAALVLLGVIVVGLVTARRERRARRSGRRAPQAAPAVEAPAPAGAVR